MQINPISNTNFTGTFVRNEAWNSVKSILSNKYDSNLSTARWGLEKFEPYIDLIEQHCPETSVYEFEFFWPKFLSDTKMLALLRNGEQIGSAEYITNFNTLVESVKDRIVRDAVGKF